MNCPSNLFFQIPHRTESAINHFIFLNHLSYVRDHDRGHGRDHDRDRDHDRGHDHDYYHDCGHYYDVNDPHQLFINSYILPFYFYNLCI